MRFLAITNRRFFRFAIVGLASNAALLVLFAAVMSAGLGAVQAAVLTYAVGVGSTYVVNRSWSFGSSEAHRRVAPQYVAAHIVGAITQACLQWGLHSQLGLPALLVQALGIVLVAVLLFLALDKVVFRES